MQPVIRLSLALGLAALGAGASAVGLGPLRKSGVTDGPTKGFYLTLINPYPHAERFAVNAIGATDETPAARVRLFPALVTMAPNRTRQILVVVRALEPEEQYRFRVCAEKPPLPQETVHARVCSTLVARRLPLAPTRTGAGPRRLPAPAA